VVLALMSAALLLLVIGGGLYHRYSHGRSRNGDTVILLAALALVFGALIPIVVWVLRR
jgi:hypothetical protein